MMGDRPREYELMKEQLMRRFYALQEAAMELGVPLPPEQLFSMAHEYTLASHAADEMTSNEMTLHDYKQRPQVTQQELRAVTN